MNLVVQDVEYDIGVSTCDDLEIGPCEEAATSEGLLKGPRRVELG